MEDEPEEGEEFEGIPPETNAIPNEAADPRTAIDEKIPKDIREKYEILSYRNAAVILSETRQSAFNELLAALRSFKISTDMIRRAGGNESDVPKLFTEALRPVGWYET